jgi:hypothetical protein
MPTQKGFVLLIPLVVLSVLAIAGIGGFLLYKSQTVPIAKVAEKTTEKKADEVKLEGKIIFVSAEKQISVADPNATNIKALSTEPEFQTTGESELPPRIISISPDQKKILFYNSVDHTINDYVASTDGTNIKLIKSLPITRGKNINYEGWTADSSKLVYVDTEILNKFSAETKKNEEYTKTIIGTYDPETQENQDLYLLGTDASVLYYNQQQNLLVYKVTTEKDLGRSYTSQLFKLNLETQELEEFPTPTIESASLTMLNNEFFLTTDAEFSAKERKEVVINSYQKPNIPIATLSLDDPLKNFGNFYLLSPDTKYIALPTSEALSKNRELYIYSTEGKKISSIDLEGFGSIGNWLFSPDSSKILIIGETFKAGDKYIKRAWQVFDLKTGKPITEKIYDPDNKLTLDPAFWLK